MSTPIWKLQAFDREGNIIGTISKPAGGPVTMEGTPDAFACCIPDLAKLPAYFADPENGIIEDVARQLYEEFVRQYKFTSATPTSWHALKRSESHSKLVPRWLAIARKFLTTPATAN